MNNGVIKQGISSYNSYSNNEISGNTTYFIYSEGKSEFFIEQNSQNDATFNAGIIRGDDVYLIYNSGELTLNGNGKYYSDISLSDPRSVVASNDFYAIKNEGVLIFEKHFGLSLGNGGGLGVTSQMKNAIFDFGTKGTTFEGIVHTSDFGKWAEPMYGLSFMDDAKLKGKLYIKEILGGNAINTTNDPYAYAGFAIGISLNPQSSNNMTITLEDFDITVDKISAGSIYIDEQKTAYAKGSLSGGTYAIGFHSDNDTVTLKGNGRLAFLNIQEGVSLDYPNKNPAFISMKDTNKLIFDGAISLIAGNADPKYKSGMFGFYNDISTLEYLFGTTGVVFTKIGEQTNSNNDGSNGEKAYGFIALGDSVSSGKLVFNSILGQNGSTDTQGSSNGAGGDSYGLFVGGNTTFTNSGNFVFESIVAGNSGGGSALAGNAVGIFVDSGTSTLEGNGSYDIYQLQSGTDSSNQPLDHFLIDINSNANLILGNQIKISQGTRASDLNSKSANVFAYGSEKVGIRLGDNSSITFNGDLAFDRELDTSSINLELGNSSILAFNGEVGNIDALKGEQASIRIAGSSQDKVNERYASSFVGKTMTISDMRLNNSSFLLAFDEQSAVDSNLLKQSDKIVISGTSETARQKLDNTLYLIMRNISSSPTAVNADESGMAIFAEVSGTAKDIVTFNGLTTSGDEAETDVYQGFITAKIKITRSDTADTAYYYTKVGNPPSQVSISENFLAPTAVALSTNLSFVSANLNSLNKRMGELKANNYSQGAWARVFTGQQETNFGAKQSVDYTTIQTGYDYRFDIDTHRNYLGYAISYVMGNGGEVDPVYEVAPILNGGYLSGITSSKTRGIEFALYNSFLADFGLYSDTIVKTSYYFNTVNMFMQDNSYEINNFSASVSQEIGYMVKFGSNNEWGIAPQAEFSYAYVQGSSFTQYMNQDTLYSSQDDTMLLRSRVGLSASYDFASLINKKDVGFSLYVGTYYAYDYILGGDTHLSTYNNGNKIEHTYNAFEGTDRLVLNVGSNISIKDCIDMYLDFEKSFFGKIQTNYQANIGIRLSLDPQ